MQNTVFWERAFDCLVQEEVDILMRRWIHRVTNMPDVLDTPPEGRRGPGETPMPQRRKSLAEDAQQYIARTLADWGLEVEKLEFLNIKLDPDYLFDMRFEHNIEHRKRVNEVEADELQRKLEAHARAQASAVKGAIVAVGEGIEDLRAHNIEPSTDHVAEMMRIAMQEITMILRKEYKDLPKTPPAAAAATQSNGSG
jgi:regulator of protease activity HflC (stomatin/prohibitin superfamily)